LVVLDRHHQPLTTDPSSRLADWNIIMWMDHRAQDDVKQINVTRHPVLQFVGGKMSLEMQMPKLSWLKRKLPETWKHAAHLFDLPDFLSFMASGQTTRSLCSLVCKWGFVDGHSELEGWSDDFLSQIGLPELREEQYAKLGNQPQRPGQRVGYVTPSAAHHLGVTPECVVATSSIDAHAGVLGTCGANLPLADMAAHPSAVMTALSQRLCLILGTSACHMVLNQRMTFVPGVWGPYHDVVVPDMWLNEGGQSAAGAALDYIVSYHQGRVR
jgi:FGGY-family pentulose kinase